MGTYQRRGIMSQLQSYQKWIDFWYDCAVNPSERYTRLITEADHILTPEVDLLSETGGVGGVLVAAVHLIHTVVIGVPVAGPAGPLLKHAETQCQFQQ
jgi:hypothetical protein